MITEFDLSAIWLDVDPPAKEAFERLSKDHGRRFAEQARDHILGCKLIEMNMEAIKAGLPRLGRH